MLVALLACLAGMSSALGQKARSDASARPTGSPPPASRAALASPHIGLCQCIAEHSRRDIRCEQTAEECQAACNSTVFSFVPLVRGALTMCPPKELFVVLPNADGRPGSGAINVVQGDKSTLLDTAYAGAELRKDDAAAIAAPPDDVGEVFRKAFDALPVLPRHFRLFFELGSDRITPQSSSEFDALLADIKRRRVYEIELIGNTDSVAGEAHNQKLSLDRAAAIQHALQQQGIDPRTMSTSGRADRDLLVRGKKTPEPQNRRVDVTVR